MHGLSQEEDGEQEQAAPLAQSLRHNLQLLQEAVAEKVVETEVINCCTNTLPTSSLESPSLQSAVEAARAQVEATFANRLLRDECHMHGLEAARQQAVQVDVLCLLGNN